MLVYCLPKGKKIAYPLKMTHYNANVFSKVNTIKTLLYEMQEVGLKLEDLVNHIRQNYQRNLNHH